MVLPLGKLKPSVDYCVNLHTCIIWNREKVGFVAVWLLVVSCVEYLTWMLLLLAPSMIRLFFVKLVLKMKEDDILIHLKGS